MSLRARLTIAFFAISVVPLTAVTLVSYYSSGKALRRAAEQQATNMAAELGHRMEWVTQDLERRMDRLWREERFAVYQKPAPLPKQLPGGAGVAATTANAQREAGPGGLAGELAGLLGEVAPMLETLEIETGGTDSTGQAADQLPVPRPTAMPAAPTPAPSGASEEAAVSPVPTSDVPPPQPARAPILAMNKQGRLVVEMGQVIDLAMKKYAGAQGASQAETAAWAKALQEQILRGAAELQRAAEQRNRDAAAQARSDVRPRATDAGPARRAAVPVRTRTVFKGDDVSLLVHQDGHEVGRVNARLNVKRLLGTVLANSRREQGEIPFAIDSAGNLHSPGGQDRERIASLKLAGSIPREGTAVRSEGDWVVVTRKDRTGVTFGIARPIADDLRDLRGVAARNFGMGFGLIALVFAGSVPLAGGMTRHLRTLMAGVQQISRGNLQARIPVRSRDEFGQLAGAFNQMAEDLATHQRLLVEQERLRRELELCRQIQIGILPREPLHLAVAEVQGLSIPAREVGGDFFNYFQLPSGDIAVLVGDVSGKGVGAALLMANVQATLRARLPLEQDLAKLADALDHDLEANTPPEVYLTLFLGIVEPARGVLRYVNAGHNTQFALRRDGSLERMSTTGMPIGLFAGHGYQERTLALAEGDILFFYTDGMVETENESGGVWGVERLEALLQMGPSTDVNALLVRVENDVRSFRGSAEPLDDATLMVLRFGHV